MNYKNLIEKTAAQVMPHRLANGGYAIPRYMEADGGLGSDRDEMNMYLDDWNADYDVTDPVYEKVPEGMTPFAGSGWDQTLMHDESGNLHMYDGYDGTIRALDDDEISDLYSTVDVDEKALEIGRSVPMETLSRLARKYPSPNSAYSMPAGGINDMGQVNNMMAESRNIKKSTPSLAEYQELGLYDKALAKQDRRDAFKKSISNIPTTLKWSAGTGAMGALMGYDASNSGRAALIGAGIGAGIPLAIGASNAIRNYKNAPINHARRNTNQAINAVRMDEGNQEFLSQYKEASEYKADIEKTAATTGEVNKKYKEKNTAPRYTLKDRLNPRKPDNFMGKVKTTMTPIVDDGELTYDVVSKGLGRKNQFLEASTALRDVVGIRKGEDEVGEYNDRMSAPIKRLGDAQSVMTKTRAAGALAGGLAGLGGALHSGDKSLILPVTAMGALAGGLAGNAGAVANRGMARRNLVNTLTDQERDVLVDAKQRYGSQHSQDATSASRLKATNHYVYMV